MLGKSRLGRGFQTNSVPLTLSEKQRILRFKSYRRASRLPVARATNNFRPEERISEHLHKHKSKTPSYKNSSEHELSFLLICALCYLEACHIPHRIFVSQTFSIDGNKYSRNRLRCLRSAEGNLIGLLDRCHSIEVS